jgi:hypothetical protein
MTIKRAEGVGSPMPSAATIAAIRAALESAGVIFVDPNGAGPGVRLRNDGICRRHPRHRAGPGVRLRKP